MADDGHAQFVHALLHLCRINCSCIYCIVGPLLRALGLGVASRWCGSARSRLQSFCRRARVTKRTRAASRGHSCRTHDGQTDDPPSTMACQKTLFATTVPLLCSRLGSLFALARPLWRPLDDNETARTVDEMKTRQRMVLGPCTKRRCCGTRKVQVNPQERALQTHGPTETCWK